MHRDGKVVLQISQALKPKYGVLQQEVTLELEVLYAVIFHYICFNAVDFFVTL